MGGGEGMGADDRAELDARLDAIAGEDGAALLDVLIGRLAEIVARQVPVRRIDAGPVAGTARVSFADGTRVIAHGVPPGALAGVAMAVLKRQGVCLRNLQRRPAAIAAELRSDQNKRVAILILGPDQSD